MEKPTPRVNSGMLPQYTNTSVRLVGKVLQVQGTKAVLEASDHGKVTIDLMPANNFGTQYVEVIGLVQDGRSIQEYSSCNLGDTFDLGNYNKLVELSQKYQDLFQ
ncbi:hypothetical protein H4R35_006829 [Dimargaris xerosporica]|nr:hypothetical protein H4R35_006829 [Dimargaris xerosporica]